jgi:hypothetical protein
LIVGNHVCGGLPCTERIAFSFDVTDQSAPPYYEEYISNNVDSSSGPLGSFTGVNAFVQDPTIGGGGPDSNFLALTDSEGDQIDLFPYPGLVSTPAPPSPSSPQLYGCGTETCILDFVPPDEQFLLPPQLGIFLPGTLEYSVTETPEPPTIILFASGILLLGLATVVSGKVARGSA